MKSNFLNEFLWSCAGVDKDIIRKYPSEWSKYACVGGTILFTAVMAMISGGYAMFFVFNSYIAACLFSIVWALGIFNLDRLIVNSMGTDGTDKLTWKKVGRASPRIVLAVIIGLVIATPLEMKIFEDRIEAQLLKDNIERVNIVKNQQTDYKQLEQLQGEYTLLRNQRTQLSQELQDAQKDLKQEAEGTALSGKVGHGAIYKDKEIYVNQCKDALNEWDKVNSKKVKDLENQINEVNQKIVIFEAKVDDVREDGFAARYQAFGKLKDESRTFSMVAFMISLLFIVIEVTPTFFKLIMVEGSYSEDVHKEEYKTHIQAEEEKADADARLKLIKLKNEKLLEKTQIQQDKILKQILEPEPIKPKQTLLLTAPKVKQTETMILSAPKVRQTQQMILSTSKPKPNQVPFKESKPNRSDTMVITSKKQPEVKFKTNKQGQVVMDFRPKHK